MLCGIDILRKICNHPDILLKNDIRKPSDYGNIERSGKLKVLNELLPLWKEQGHKVLLFAQTRQMLDILEQFLVNGDFSFCRLDGTTPIKNRMNIVNNFNKNPDLFCFMLSTRAGGLGLNLVGANRVIIFDPGTIQHGLSNLKDIQS